MSEKFSLKHNMKRHQLIHTEKKPFHCNDFEMKFRHDSGLKSHQRHKHTVKKPFECNDCDIKFRQSVSLKNHQRNKYTLYIYI